ncbi:MAG: NAD(P)H-binding protein [Anaerolineae bacterium]|nr:NAD(P)H-binding protein [Anaerolineae bacterium]
MRRVLLTGGTGVLGRELIPRLQAVGYIVRVMSRRAAKAGEGFELEWAQASLDSGTGLAEAVEQADVILHAASSPVKRQVDIGGTGRLLEHARRAGIDHFVYISIVGIDRIGFSYYRNKLAAESLIKASGVPWTILRATQFHDLIDRLLGGLTRLPVAFVPKNWQFQSINTSEVAEQLVAAVQAGPAGQLPDIGGPEVLNLEEMARLWLAARGTPRPLVHLPLPGKLAAGFRQGLNTTPHNRGGKITWADWVQTRYSSSLKMRMKFP